MNISSIDLQLLLQFGKDINAFDNVYIKPYKLNEIVDFGYSKYENVLRWISIDLDGLIDSVDDEDKREELLKSKDKLKTYDFYSSLGGEMLQQQMFLGLAMIFRTDDVMYSSKTKETYINFIKEGLFTVEDNEYKRVEGTEEKQKKLLNEGKVIIVDRNNYDSIIDVVRLQNYLQKVEERDTSPNPADEETRMLLEQMAKMREKVDKIKKEQSQQENSEIDFASIVSAVGSKSNSINRMNIGELTIFEIYDEYSRLELIDAHKINIQAMMAGAKDVNNKHWSSKL